jgi:hypothetical protein
MKNVRYPISITAASLVISSLLRAQSYSPISTPTSSISGGYQCLDQNNQPIPYASFSIYSFVYLYTNAHLHDSPSHPFPLYRRCLEPLMLTASSISRSRQP